MQIHKGDKVRAATGGPTMEVLAASPRLAICGWVDAGVERRDVFALTDLHKVVAQQAQQPQGPAPDAAPGGDTGADSTA